MNEGKNRKTYMEVCSIFLLVAGFFCIFGGNSAYAQEGEPEQISEEEQLKDVETMTPEEMKAQGIPQGGLQISPTKFVWTLEEGATKSGRVIVKNYSDMEQTVTMEVEDFFVEDDGKTPQLYVPDDDHELKALDVRSWITPPDSFTIPAGGAKAVEFTVRVPDGQPTNGYYGSLLFRTGGPSEEEDGSRIGLSYRIGALVIMAVQGDEPMAVEGEILDFYPEKNIFWESPVALFTRVNNTGNIHFPLFGTIEVERFGKKFHEIELTPRLLYPQKAVDYREIMEFDMWDFGKFDARVALNSEDGSVQMDGATSFWIIPWKLLVLVAVSLIALVVLLKLFRRYVHIGVGDRQKTTRSKK